MGTIIFIVIVLVVIVMIAASKNEKTSTSSSTEQFISTMQDEFNEKAHKILEEITKIGFDALSSLKMSKREKEDLMIKVVDSIREHAPNDEQKYMCQIMRSSYEFFFEKFSFDREFCTELLRSFDKFEQEIKEGTIESYGWIELIDAVEKEKAKICNAKKTDEPEYSETLSFAVKGLNYRNEDELETAEKLEVGDDLILEEEPTNEYDPFAIKVLTAEEYQIGYVEATKAKFISENTHRLAKCKIKQISQYDDDLYIYGVAYFE